MERGLDVFWKELDYCSSNYEREDIGRLDNLLASEVGRPCGRVCQVKEQTHQGSTPILKGSKKKYKILRKRSRTDEMSELLGSCYTSVPHRLCVQYLVTAYSQKRDALSSLSQKDTD